MQDVVTPSTSPAERAQQVRDLRDEIGRVGDVEQGEIILPHETTPPRRRTTIYSMVDGEPISVPVINIQRLIERRLPSGGYMFTSKPEAAPPYKLGEIKCFLHAESPERPILDEIGLSGITCPAGHLANAYSKRMHGLHRHKDQWQALQDYLNQEKERLQNDRQDRQLSATLALAEKAAGPTNGYRCECGWHPSRGVRRPSVALESHRRMTGHAVAAGV